MKHLTSIFVVLMTVVFSGCGLSLPSDRQKETNHGFEQLNQGMQQIHRDIEEIKKAIKESGKKNSTTSREI